MRVGRSLYVVPILLCVASSAWAEFATEVVTRNRGGREHRALITADKVRMDLGAGSYLLADLVKDGKFYRVDPTLQRIVDLSAAIGQRSASNAANQTITTDVKLVEAGEGPEIAGYSTNRYRFMAGERICGEFLVSSQVLEVEHLRRFSEVMRDIRSLTVRRGTPLWGLARNPCSRARMELDEELSRLGLPLRTFDENGNINQEVITIKPGVLVTPEEMALPDGYRITTTQNIVRKAVNFGRTGGTDPAPVGHGNTGDEGQMEEERLRKRINVLEKQLEELKRRLEESGKN